MCCMRLAANAGPKKVAKNRHLGTIGQLCRAISSQIRHVSTIGKKLVKQQYLPHMSSQYGERRPTNGWDRFVSLGHPNFNGSRVLAALLHSQTAALNIGRHLYSAGRPSRWALAHILVCVNFSFFSTEPRDWLGRTSAKWPILYLVGYETVSQSTDCRLQNIDIIAFFDWNKFDHIFDATSVRFCIWDYSHAEAQWIK